MSEQAPGPRVFSNRFADAVGSGDIRVGYDLCSCFDYAHVQVPARKVRFHRERQDASAPGWLHRVATDVLPLLVNACSDARVGALPQGAEGPTGDRDPPLWGRFLPVAVAGRAARIWVICALLPAWRHAAPVVGRAGE